MFEEGSYRRRPRGFRRKCQSIQAAVAAGKGGSFLTSVNGTIIPTNNINTTATNNHPSSTTTASSSSSLTNTASGNGPLINGHINYATNGMSDNTNVVGQSQVSQSCTGGNDVINNGNSNTPVINGSNGTSNGTLDLDISLIHRTNSNNTEFELTSLPSLTPSGTHFGYDPSSFVTYHHAHHAHHHNPFSTTSSSSTALPSIDSTFAHSASLSFSHTAPSSSSSSSSPQPIISSVVSISASTPTYATTLHQDESGTTSIEYTNSLQACQYGTIEPHLIDHHHHHSHTPQHHHHHQHPHSQSFSQLWPNTNSGGFMLPSANGSGNSYSVTLSPHFLKNHHPYANYMGGDGTTNNHHNGGSSKMSSLLTNNNGSNHSSPTSQSSSSLSSFGSSTNFMAHSHHSHHLSNSHTHLNHHSQNGNGIGINPNHSTAATTTTATTQHHHHLQPASPYVASAMLNDLSNAAQNTHLRNAFTVYGTGELASSASPPQCSPGTTHASSAAAATAAATAALINSLHQHVGVGEFNQPASAASSSIYLGQRGSVIDHGQSVLEYHGSQSTSSDVATIANRTIVSASSCHAGVANNGNVGGLITATPASSTSISNSC